LIEIFFQFGNDIQQTLNGKGATIVLHIMLSNDYVRYGTPKRHWNWLHFKNYQ